MDIIISQITFDEVTPIIPYIREANMRVKNTETTTWFGAIHGDELVGVAACSINKQVALYKTSFVKKEFRRKGIYKRLFAERDHYISKQNVRKIKAYCTPYSVTHLLNCGFVEVGKRNQITFVEKKIYLKPRIEKIAFSTFCSVIKGSVMYGPDEFSVYDITDRSIYLKRPNTILFIREKLNKINWKYVRKFTPCAIVFEKGKEPASIIPGFTYVMVDNMAESYWRFVDYYRQLFDIPVLAVTGTCGKTTTKEMIAYILKEKHQVQSTRSSNNSFYLNLNYLCGITSQTDVAVFETPVGGKGLLEYHCKYFKPTIGLITNIGIDHIKQCGSIENYVQAKGEILKGLDYKGILIINADDDNIKKILLNKFKGKLVTFGVHSQADFRAENIQYGENGMTFKLLFEGHKYDMFVPGYGEHQVYNVLGAIAAVHQVGFSLTEAIERVRSFSNVKAHLEIFEGHNGVAIVDDTWSANPTSIEASLKAFKNILKNKKNKIAVIGTVALLGDDEASFHREIGKTVAQYGIDTLVVFGNLAGEMAAGAQAHGMSNIIICKGSEDIEKVLFPLFNETTAVLLKASMYDKSVIQLINNLKKTK